MGQENNRIFAISNEIITQKTLILTCGLPRSGKTTWARKQGVPIVSPDSIRLALHGQRFLKEAEPMVWTMAAYMAKALFLAGHEKVIVDATNVTAKRREFWLEKFPSTEGYKVDLLIESTAPEVCIERARAEGDETIIPVIERMAAEWDLGEFLMEAKPIQGHEEDEYAGRLA